MSPENIHLHFFLLVVLIRLHHSRVSLDVCIFSINTTHRYTGNKMQSRLDERNSELGCWATLIKKQTHLPRSPFQMQQTDRNKLTEKPIIGVCEGSMYVWIGGCVYGWLGLVFGDSLLVD